jgi:hypothetical protein
MLISSFDKLSKILKLEIESGLRDKAVIGGLGKFADFWEKEAAREAPAEQVTQIVGLQRTAGSPRARAGHRAHQDIDGNASAGSHR